jgi:hypothetical protein
MIGELARDSFRAATRGWDFDKSTETVKFVMTWPSRRKIGRLATLVELGKSDTDSILYLHRSELSQSSVGGNCKK